MMRWRLASAAWALIAVACVAQDLAGFAPENVAAQRDLETRFKKLVSAESAKAQLRRLTENPHVAGTDAGLAVADYIAAQYARFGLEPSIHEYMVYLPQPETVFVQMLEPSEYWALGKEDGWEGDKDSFEDVIPGFNAYSADGDVTAEAVYVNKGLPEDYAALDQLGVAVAGKVCVARYGGSYRGVKAKVAADRGAAALILYSDPKDDGYARGDIYPRGPWRSADAIQRGTVKYIWQHASDPLTPGWASTENAERLTRDEATDLPPIPVAPLAWRDAAPILEALGGPNVPRDWQGGLPFAYHTGPGPSIVRVVVQSNHENRLIRNVVASVEGSEDPHRWVILGNHHDAWTFGAADPGSGTAALLEVARAMGELLREGIRPRRTVVFASWDAEEYGILGATEWVEQFEQELNNKAVAYLNVDIAATGPNFGASAVSSLKPFVRDATRDVVDPDTLGSVYDAWKQGQDRDSPSVGNLGSGSDHSPFVGHAGIASVSMGFHGSYGVYHAMQDNFHWMERFGDPTFRYHATMARVWGVMALRLANADLLPFDHAAYARDMRRAFEKFAEEHADDLAGRNGVPLLRDALTKWRDIAAAVDLNVKARVRGGRLESAQEINRRLFMLERLLTTEEGLPGRPWFKHVMVAPGLNSGYAAVLFPGLQDAFDTGDLSRVDEQLQELIDACDRASAQLAAILSLD